MILPPYAPLLPLPQSSIRINMILKVASFANQADGRWYLNTTVKCRRRFKEFQSSYIGLGYWRLTSPGVPDMSLIVSKYFWEQGIQVTRWGRNPLVFSRWCEECLIKSSCLRGSHPKGSPTIVWYSVMITERSFQRITSTSGVKLLWNCGPSSC